MTHSERIRLVAETLLSPDSFSGWGIRTVAAGQARYNPLSYHNGSIWPHDNSLIASGLARYGCKDLAGRILLGLLDASRWADLGRLPELFCGLDRRRGEGPTLYPVLLAAGLGLGSSILAGAGMPRSLRTKRWQSDSV